ncbi:3-oxoacyl-[acyl-carrier-protein] synthase III C-terminal domain-containing protein [Mesorhizobium sp. LHD-90]|uniref:3-oxoacyl-ACP synthase III family protein n=1 Tax=Mesorhizobium sp. LHD-90 TaxID=3071414 RepID=UPI0027DF3363|nr:3-oxoacyl-[acyl-carrier-protein] synthase III C-terminal domain-containing protein [Mesorhizobium sp. LHD-90]MDQ6434277.1 3-oxoacyl-[acyl-carrier-protein] synthase III C-terminal domain-containing protein [Mesorhizobium sp. LHD-90]
MTRRFRRIKVLGSGSALPARILRSSEIDARLGKPAGWVEKRVGVASRPVCEAEDQIDLATVAACRALEDAGCKPQDIDLVMFAAAVPYQSIPTTAPLIQHRLGIPEGCCAAFDINSTCLSFLTAMDVAASMLAAGTCRQVLVISSEIASRGLPWEAEPLVAALFGDGAAAVVVGAEGEKAGILASRMATYPSGYEDCQLGAGGTRYYFHRDREEFARHTLFEMDGKALFRHTIQFFEPFLDRLLADAGWSRDDVEIVIPHQASPMALAHLAERCGFGSRIVDIMRDHGNQIAASIPIALDTARRSGRLEPGAKALMLGTSAGLSLGGIAFVA